MKITTLLELLKFCASSGWGMMCLVSYHGKERPLKWNILDDL